MRNRKVQRMLRKTGEKGLSPRDDTGLLDLTPFEAVREIIKKQKAAAARAAKEALAALEKAGEEEAEEAAEAAGFPPDESAGEQRNDPRGAGNTAKNEAAPE